MTEPIYRRLVVLVVLGMLGVGLAVVGSAVGTDASVDGPSAVGEVSVSGESLTVSDETRGTIAVEDLSATQRIEVTTDDGGFDVRTESGQPLTQSERDRAAETARRNGTVGDYIQRVEEYSLEVEPIERLDADGVRNISVRGTVSSGESVAAGSASGNESFIFVEPDDQDVDESVTVARNRTYVDGEANVRVYGPDGEVRYSLTVDLMTGRVEDITDWNAVRTR